MGFGRLTQVYGAAIRSLPEVHAGVRQDMDQPDEHFRGG